MFCYRKLSFIILILAAVSRAHSASASELSLSSRLRLAEEYNDNILTTRDNQKADFITHVNPGVNIEYLASRLVWNLNYSPEYLKFARYNEEDRINHFLNTVGRLTVVENRLFLKASDNYSIVSTTAVHNLANSGGYSEQTSQNLFSVSPYAEFHPDGRTLLRTGYIYNNWNYGNHTAIDKYENAAFVNVNRDISRKTWLLLNARYGYITPEEGSEFSRTTISAGVKREYATNSFANIEAGYSFFDYKKGKSISAPFWLAALQHDFGATKVIASAGVTYDIDPYLSSTENRNAGVRLENRSGRGIASIFVSYDEHRDDTSGDRYSWSNRGGGRYEYGFTPQFSGMIEVVAEKYGREGSWYGLPCHTIESAGIKYIFPNNLAASFTYSHLAWSERLWSGNDSIETNRVMLELVMTFPPLRKTF